MGPWAAAGRGRQGQRERRSGKGGCSLRCGIRWRRTGRWVRDSGSSRQRQAEQLLLLQAGWVERAVTFWCWASPASLSQDCCLCSDESGAALPRFPPTRQCPVVGRSCSAPGCSRTRGAGWVGDAPENPCWSKGLCWDEDTDPQLRRDAERLAQAVIPWDVGMFLCLRPTSSARQ